MSRPSFPGEKLRFAAAARESPRRPVRPRVDALVCFETVTVVDVSRRQIARRPRKGYLPPSRLLAELARSFPGRPGSAFEADIAEIEALVEVETSMIRPRPAAAMLATASVPPFGDAELFDEAAAAPPAMMPGRWQVCMICGRAAPPSRHFRARSRPASAIRGEAGTAFVFFARASLIAPRDCRQSARPADDAV